MCIMFTFISKRVILNAVINFTASHFFNDICLVIQQMLMKYVFYFLR
jgi:hypothetical protein